MKHYENMTISELLEEHDKQKQVAENAISKIDKIHGAQDYSDEVAKFFHCGMVGFRKDRKKVNRTLNKAIDNGVAAVALYHTRDEAESKLKTINKYIAEIERLPQDRRESSTYFSIKAEKRAQIVSKAPALAWCKVDGGYKSGEFRIARADDLSFLYHGKEQIGWYKTVRDAKAAAALISSRVVT